MNFLPIFVSLLCFERTGYFFLPAYMKCFSICVTNCLSELFPPTPVSNLCLFNHLWVVASSFVQEIVVLSVEQFRFMIVHTNNMMIDWLWLIDWSIMIDFFIDWLIMIDCFIAQVIGWLPNDQACFLSDFWATNWILLCVWIIRRMNSYR